MVNTKVQIQQGEISITFEGTESFVKEQLKNLSKTLEILQGQGVAIKTTKPESFKVVPPNKSGKILGGITEISKKYPTIFAEDDDIVKIILSKLPGKTDKEKSENLVLLYALANENKFTDKKIPYKNLVDQKKNHGIVDKGGNFSSYVKGLKSQIIFNGKGNNATVKLTVPGRQDAEKLCEEIMKENEQ